MSKTIVILPSIDIIKILVQLLSNTNPLHGLPLTSICKTITNSNIRKNLYNQILLIKSHFPVFKELIIKTCYIKDFLEKNIVLDLENQSYAFAITPNRYYDDFIEYTIDDNGRTNCDGWFIRIILRHDGHGFLCDIPLSNYIGIVCGFNNLSELILFMSNLKYDFIKNHQWKDLIKYYMPISNKYYLD